MRKLLIGLLCASTLAAPVSAADSVATVLTPTPISAAITIGTWIFTSDRKKLYEVEVQAQADTFDAAKKEGFRLAVEHAVGSLILSETEVHGDKIKRDEIITYASGYVDRFEIVKRTDAAPGVRLHMKIWVAHSGIAQRLFNKSEAAGNLEGERVSAKVETYQHYRNSADRVLSAVLNDYPQRAFDVSLEPSQVTLDTQRRPRITVPFVLRWNEKYLNSFVETVEQINPHPECTSWTRQCNTRSTVIVRVNAVTKDPQAWFDDDITWNVLFQRMILSRPMYRVLVYNSAGYMEGKFCYPARELDGLEYRPRYFVEAGAGKVAINGMMTQRIWLTLPDDVVIGNLGRVNLSVVPSSQCN